MRALLSTARKCLMGGIPHEKKSARQTARRNQYNETPRADSAFCCLQRRQMQQWCDFRHAGVECRQIRLHILAI